MARLLLFIVSLALSCSCALAQQRSGLFWKVVRPGRTDTSFLLGTMHMYPQTVVEISPDITQQLSRCRQLYIEIQPDLKMTFQMLTSGSMYTELMTNEDREWTQEDWGRIHHWFVTERNMPESQFEALRQNASSDRLVQMFMSLYGYAFTAVEDDLRKAARSQRIPIKGLDRNWEEIAQWYAHYAQINTAYWQEGPLDSLLNDSYYGLADLVIGYAIQDTAMLNLASKDMAWKDNLPLVAWRNHQWMQQLPTLMQQQSFVAVGAAHLFGEHGVVRLLQQAGFLCLPIPAAFDGPRLERFIRRNGRQYQLPEDP